MRATDLTRVHDILAWKDPVEVRDRVIPLTFLEQADIFAYHRSMLADRARTEPFQRALASTVRQGDVVLDLGSGTGFLACLACQAGASRVYAIESGPVVELARLVARENGLADRITFIPRASLEAELPEKVDVVVSETLGNFGLDEGLLDWVLDARGRFLKPGGTLIPRAVELFVAPVSHPDFSAKAEAWRGSVHGVRLGSLRDLAMNNMYGVMLDRAAFLGEPASLGRVELTRLDRADFAGRATLSAARAGTMDGLGGWFLAELAEGVHITNAPPNQARSWSHRLLPLERPLEISPGDQIEVEVSTALAGSRWGWQTRARGVDLQQGTLFGYPLAMEALARQQPAYRPALARRGEATLFALQRIAEGVVRSDLESCLRSRFADVFRTPAEAGLFVTETIAGCC